MAKVEFSIWRVMTVAAIALLLAAGVAWYDGLWRPGAPQRPANSLVVIAPYRYAGMWVFDDAAVGLKREPFVAGIPEMIDNMVKDIPNAPQGFRLVFSAQPFPGYMEKLTWRRGDHAGNWYYSETLKKEGWLCPGLFKYYTDPPKELYAKAEKI